MIISASRRTDIPAFFSEKFYNDIAKGFTYSKNPYNGKEYRVDLSPSAVDAIVFWTKNAKPMLPKPVYYHTIRRYDRTELRFSTVSFRYLQRTL